MSIAKKLSPRRRSPARVGTARAASSTGASEGRVHGPGQGSDDKCEAALIESRWFLAKHLLTQSKSNVTALELIRHLGGLLQVMTRTDNTLSQVPVASAGSLDSTEIGVVWKLVLLT